MVLESVVGFKFSCSIQLCSIRNWNPREEGTFVLNHVPRNRDMIRLIKLKASSIDIGLFNDQLPSITIFGIVRSEIESVFLPANARIQELTLERTKLRHIYFQKNNTYLENLRITKCLLRTIPKSIGHLTNIRDVAILDTHLKIVDFESLESLLHLQELNLKHNKINYLHPSELSGPRFPSLVGIYLRGNRLKTIDMSVFSSMMSLSCLDLSENRVEHVEGTIASSNLTALRLSCNRLTKLDCCNWNLSSLTYFKLSNNKLNNLPACMSVAMPVIETLILDFNNLTDDGFWNTIASMRSLHTLSANYNSLSIVDLTNVKVQLSSLSLHNNKIRHLNIPLTTAPYSILVGCNFIEEFRLHVMYSNIGLLDMECNPTDCSYSNMQYNSSVIEINSEERLSICQKIDINKECVDKCIRTSFS